MADRRPGTAAVKEAQRRRAWLIAAAVLLVAVAIAVAATLARGISWRAPAPILGATLSAPDRLVLIVGTCGGEPELDVLREQDAAVEVTVVSTRRFGGAGEDCRDPLEVTLEAPLGDRHLVDATTGENVNVDAG